jgi:hypothetical protein
MAEVRSWYEYVEWREFGLTYNRVDANTIGVQPVSSAALFKAGMRIRVTDPTNGDIFGVVRVVDAVTTGQVTVQFDNQTMTGNPTAVYAGLDVNATQEYRTLLTTYVDAAANASRLPADWTVSESNGVFAFTMPDLGTTAYTVQVTPTAGANRGASSSSRTSTGFNVHTFNAAGDPASAPFCVTVVTFPG